jgi:protein subunit release factor A
VQQMKIKTDEIKTSVFRPDDESFSSAVKIIHNPSGKEFICDEYQSQVENRRAAVKYLISELCSGCKDISTPKYVPFDRIITLHPNTEREGYIREII